MDNSVYESGANANAHDKKLGWFGPVQLVEEIEKLNVLIAQVGGVVNTTNIDESIKKMWNETFIPSWATYSKPRTPDFYNNEPRYQLPENLVGELNELRRFQNRLVAFVGILRSRGVQIGGVEDKKDGLAMSTKVMLVAGGGLLLYVLAKEVGKGVVGRMNKVIDGE
jgi:hypothetical protein